MKRIFIFYIGIILLGSCIKEVPLKSDVYVEPRPVFHCYLEPDSILFADYGRVSSISDPNSTADSALISLFRNNAFQGDMPPIGKGKYYFLNNPFQPRDSFRIYGSDGLYSFFVRGRVPSRIVLNVTDTQTVLIPGIGPSFALDISFTDSAIDDNFYRLFLRKHFMEYTLDKSGNRTDSIKRVKILEIRGSEFPFIQNNFNNYTSSEILFSDATFNGTTPIYRIYTPGKMWGDKGVRNLKLEVILENIEKPLYEYYNTRNAHLWQQQSISQLPGNISGNVAAGYGVAGAYTKSVKTVSFE